MLNPHIKFPYLKRSYTLIIHYKSKILYVKTHFLYLAYWAMQLSDSVLLSVSVSFRIFVVELELQLASALGNSVMGNMASLVDNPHSKYGLSRMCIILAALKGWKSKSHFLKLNYLYWFYWATFYCQIFKNILGPVAV